jgi:hypothetical protein
MARPGLRFVPLLGALFVLLVVIGFIVAGDTPDTDSGATQIRADYDDETRHQAGAYLVALGAIALLFFGAYWRTVLGFLHPTGRTTARAALAGAVVAASGLGVMSLIHAALADAAQQSELTDPVLQALNVLDNWSFYPFSIGFVVFVLASGIALLRGRAFFPPWLGWAALVIGVLGLVPFLTFFSNVAAAVWVIVVSLMLFARWEAVEQDGARLSAP